MVTLSCSTKIEKKCENFEVQSNFISSLGHTKFIIRLTDAASLIGRFEKKKNSDFHFIFHFLVATKSKAQRKKKSP